MKVHLAIVVILSILISCNNQNKANYLDKPDWSKEESMQMNYTFSAEEEEAIDSYLSRRPDWKMIETGTGLRYFIYEKGTESLDSVKTGDIVTVNFSIELLNGKECYKSKSNDPETFMVEKTDIESGLHEAIKYMKLGDKAQIILPSHLAHGLIGDLDKIPPLETVVYNIHLLNINMPYGH